MTPKARKSVVWGPYWLALGVLLCLPGVSRADLLVTGQGESLSGELSRIVNGILVFRTSMRGQMMVPMSEVRSLSTDAAWAVTDASGAVHIGRFVPGGIAATPDGAESDAVETLALEAVSSAKRLPTGIEPGSKASGADSGWTGYGGTGVRVFEGAEDGVAPQVTLGVRGTDERGAVDVDMRFDAESEDGFPGYYRGRFELSGAPERPWKPFVQALAERNRYQALDIRTGLTLGVRYDFDGPEPGGLSGLAGLGGSVGRWDEARFSDSRLGWAERERTQSDLNLHLELRYSRAVWGGGTWDSRLYLQPGVTDADHFRAGAESSLVYPVTARLQLRLDMLMGYDHDPVFEEIERVDTSLGASIQLEF